MTRQSNWLYSHRASVYSQGGEDGVIREILDVLPETDGWCVEFGAWDGVHLSNVRHLVEDRGYSAVLIEASERRYRDLEANYAGRSEVITVHRLVGTTPENGLDRILENTPIPTGFDLLSIDVDGNDYHIWNEVSYYRPKVVCIEFNPTIPTGIEFVQAREPSVNHGSSLLSLVKLGREKGYELVSVLDVNALFVRAEYFGLFGISDNSPATLRPSEKAVTYLFSGYDGTLFLEGGKRLPWHDMELPDTRMQPLPRFLRRYPGSYNLLQTLLLKLWKRFAE